MKIVISGASRGLGCHMAQDLAGEHEVVGFARAERPMPPEPTLDEQRALLLEHYRLMVDRFGPRKGTILMRRYACCYAQGRHGARKFRTRASRAATQEEFFAVVESDFPRA